MSTRRFFTFEIDDGGAALDPSQIPLFQRVRAVLVVVAAAIVVAGLLLTGKVILNNSNASSQAAADAAKAKATSDYLRKEVAFRDQALCLLLRHHRDDARVRTAYRAFSCSLLLRLPNIPRPTPPPGVQPLRPTSAPKPGDLGLPTTEPSPSSTPRPVPSSTHPPPTPHPTRSPTRSPSPSPSPTLLKVCITTPHGTFCEPPPH